MKISKEARLGALITAAVLIFVCGFYFLKGSNVFASKNKYYCYFDDVQGLQVSATVQVRGLDVGRVSDIDLVDNKGVKVTITVDNDIRMAKGTEAKLASADLISGTKVIKLTLSNDPEILEKESVLPSSIEKTLFDNMGDDISPVVKTAKVVMAELDSVVTGVSKVLNEKNRQAVANSLVSIEATTKNIAALSNTLRGQSDRIESILTHTDTLTANLAKTSKQVSELPLKETVEDVQRTVAQLQEIVNKINNGQGSLGMMVTDKKLYENLTASLSSLDKLLADLKAHPKRYINVSIFGRKSE